MLNVAIDACKSHDTIQRALCMCFCHRPSTSVSRLDYLWVSLVVTLAIYSRVEGLYYLCPGSLLWKMVAYQWQGRHHFSHETCSWKPDGHIWCDVGRVSVSLCDTCRVYVHLFITLWRTRDSDGYMYMPFMPDNIACRNSILQWRIDDLLGKMDDGSLKTHLRTVQSRVET